MLERRWQQATIGSLRLEYMTIIDICKMCETTSRAGDSVNALQRSEARGAVTIVPAVGAVRRHSFW